MDHSIDDIANGVLYERMLRLHQDSLKRLIYLANDHIGRTILGEFGEKEKEGIFTMELRVSDRGPKFTIETETKAGDLCTRAEYSWFTPHGTKDTYNPLISFVLKDRDERIFFDWPEQHSKKQDGETALYYAKRIEDAIWKTIERKFKSRASTNKNARDFSNYAGALDKWSEQK